MKKTLTAYTVGNPSIYDSLISLNKRLFKAKGGWIFKTKSEATEFLEKYNYSWTWDNGVTTELVIYKLMLLKPFKEIANTKDKNNIFVINQDRVAVIEGRLGDI